MINIEMIHERETPSGSIDSCSAWVNEVVDYPSDDELHEILSNEISKTKIHNLAHVLVNVWEGNGCDEWQGKLIQSVGLDARKI